MAKKKDPLSIEVREAFLGVIEDACREDLKPHLGSMNDVEFSIALKHRMKYVAAQMMKHVFGSSEGEK